MMASLKLKTKRNIFIVVYSAVQLTVARFMLMVYMCMCKGTLSSNLLVPFLSIKLLTIECNLLSL